jgi:hypothetical protein
MENEFYNVVSETRRYEISSNNLDALKGAIARWEKLLRKTDAEIIAEFESLHWTEISRVINTLRGIKDPTIRGAHDRIFKNVFGIQKRVPSALTILFAKFIKGITHFQNQNASGTETPIYHRLYSCGTGDDAFRNTFQRCTEDMDKQDRLDVRKRIETCYIERLVYDCMYRNLAMFFPGVGTEEHTQNKQHMDRLLITKTDFETCFPNLRIEIEMDFDNDAMHWPTRLTISRYIKDRPVSKETYNRTISFSNVLGDRMYEDAVDATRETDQHKYFRVQRFAYKPAWKRI